VIRDRPINYEVFKQESYVFPGAGQLYFQQLDPYRPSTNTASDYNVHHKTAFFVHGFHGTKTDE
jgi:hypothetical protein